MDTSSPLPSLLPGETILYEKDFPSLARSQPISGLKEIERLARAKNIQQIGEFGPVMASEALPTRTAEAFHEYEALFGRDSLRVALDLLPVYPKLARTTLIKLAELQGIARHTASEEEPGRIVHEARDPKIDPKAQQITKELGWEWPYYGSIDSTPEFIRTFAAYCRTTREGASFLKVTYTSKDRKTGPMSHSFEQALMWLTQRLSSNKEGILEFHRSNPQGLENQAWKDSWDSYFHADGTMANHTKGVASVEVQRLAYDALIDGAEVYETYLDKAEEATTLRALAKQLKEFIVTTLWTDQKNGYFVLGTDRDSQGALHPLMVRTSNMGHLLHSRLLLDTSEDTRIRREKLISQLFSPELFGINGIMTLATDEVRFRAGAYHNGSVWSWDNYIIAQGLATQGYYALSDYLERTIVSAIDYAGRFVEYMRGGHDAAHRINTRIVEIWDENNKRRNRLEQPPQDMQAWTTATFLAIKFSHKSHHFRRLATDKQTMLFEEAILKSLPQIN